MNLRKLEYPKFMWTLGELRGIESGRCAILANGPSLQTAAQLQRIDCPVIGINRSYERRESDYHVFIDRTALHSHIDELPLATPTIIRRQENFIVGAIQVPIDLKRLPTKFDLEKGWFVAGATIAAMQLAVHLGFNELILCGLDLKRRGKLLHFYGLGRPVNFVPQIAVMSAAYIVFRDHYKKRITAYNTCQDSAERQFQRIEFDQLWRPV